MLDKYSPSEGLCAETVLTRFSFFELLRLQRCVHWDLVLGNLGVLEMKLGNLNGLSDAPDVT